MIIFESINNNHNLIKKKAFFVFKTNFFSSFNTFFVIIPLLSLIKNEQKIKIMVRRQKKYRRTTKKNGITVDPNLSTRKSYGKTTSDLTMKTQFKLCLHRMIKTSQHLKKYKDK